jgi:glycosyltransferase involved in cell wall biosynthesis
MGAESGVTRRVAALTSGHETPSARYRIRQHIAALGAAGIDVREFCPPIEKFAPLPDAASRLPGMVRRPIVAGWMAAKVAARGPGILGSWQAQATWLERELLPGYDTAERLLRRPLVLDVDDAIWASRPGAPAAVARIARRAEVVVAGNPFLADWFSAHARDVRVVPTAVDTERVRPAASSREAGRFVVGWIGTSPNYEYIAEIETVLGRFLDEHDAELLVVADRPPTALALPPERVRFVPWTPQSEVESLWQMDVGIMPLHRANDDISRGKCSFKMLTYMAAGLPVVVSAIGMNVDVLALDEVGFGCLGDEDWFEALRILAADRQRGKALGTRGRRVVEDRFSPEVVRRKLVEVFRDVI